MKISTKGRYALRIMLDIAMHDDGKYIPLKDIAKRQNLTVKYLEQIISLLNKAGYLQSLRGNTGGYRLAKNLDEYVVGDILRVTEGDLAPVACLKKCGDFCQREDICNTVSFWRGLDRVINEYVDSYTLKDFLKQAQDKVNNKKLHYTMSLFAIQIKLLIDNVHQYPVIIQQHFYFHQVIYLQLLMQLLKIFQQVILLF